MIMIVHITQKKFSSVAQSISDAVLSLIGLYYSLTLIIDWISVTDQGIFSIQSGGRISPPTILLALPALMVTANAAPVRGERIVTNRLPSHRISKVTSNCPRQVIVTK